MPDSYFSNNISPSKLSTPDRIGSGIQRHQRLKKSRAPAVVVLLTGRNKKTKSAASKIIADDAHLDLYKVDLSTVTSKYIGETEKNLRRIFQRAEKSGAILFFDEADALFGKRTTIKDSHDRYANLETSYLLQQFQNYRGVIIISSDSKQGVNKKFLKYVRFHAIFPYARKKKKRSN